MRRTNCFGFRETVENDGTFSYDCKALTKMACDNCAFFKTHEAYNAKQVEADIAKYVDGVGQC